MMVNNSQVVMRPLVLAEFWIVKLKVNTICKHYIIQYNAVVFAFSPSFKFYKMSFYMQ